MLKNNMKQYSVKLEILHLPTGEVRTYTGYFSLKEIYLLLKKYEKDEKFNLLRIDFHCSPLFDSQLQQQVDNIRQ